MKNEPRQQASGDDGQSAPKVSRRKFIATAARAGLASAAAGGTAAAQNDRKLATPVLTGKITGYKSGDLTIPAYIARPAKKRRAAASLQRRRCRRRMATHA
jgi:hypothetical protein